MALCFLSIGCPPKASKTAMIRLAVDQLQQSAINDYVSKVASEMLMAMPLHLKNMQLQPLLTPQLQQLWQF